MLIFIMVVMVVLAIIGTYGPEHDNYKKDQKKMEEELEETRRRTYQAFEDLIKIADRRIDELTKERTKLIEEAREKGVPEEEILKMKEDPNGYFLKKE